MSFDFQFRSILNYLKLHPTAKTHVGRFGSHSPPFLSYGCLSFVDVKLQPECCEQLVPGLPHKSCIFFSFYLFRLKSTWQTVSLNRFAFSPSSWRWPAEGNVAFHHPHNTKTRTHSQSCVPPKWDPNLQDYSSPSFWLFWKVFPVSFSKVKSHLAVQAFRLCVSKKCATTLQLRTLNYAPPYLHWENKGFPPQKCLPQQCTWKAFFSGGGLRPRR